MIRIEDLRTFCTLIELHSFSKAADLCKLTQPAVTQQIKTVERQYGAQLVHRAGFDVLPTERGKAVYKAAKQIVKIFDRSRENSRKKNIEGSLTIGASSGPGEYMLPLVIGRFRQLHNKIRINLRVADSMEIVESLRNAAIDIGIVGRQRKDRYLEYEAILEDELILVAAPDHRWAGRTAVQFEELTNEPLILQQSGSGASAVLADALKEHDIKLSQMNVIMEMGLQASAVASVRAGFGVTFVSALGVREELRKRQLIRVPVTGLRLKRNIFLCRNRATPVSDIELAFISFLKESIKTGIPEL